MERILNEAEAQSILDRLSEREQAEIKRDKVRFGEYFVGLNDNNYYRLNPLNVILEDGILKFVIPFSASAGI